jgi:sugar phosphate isomerase/epimerase
MARIGAQMYTLRDHCQTVDDIARACQRLKAMGYDGIQASAGAFNTLDMDQVRRIARVLNDTGLVCGATHESLDNMRDKTEAVLEKHRILDCTYTAIGGYQAHDGFTLDNWTRFAAEFNAVAGKLHEAQLRVGYHNHNHELRPLGDGRTPLGLLIDRCDDHVWFELDVYWIAAGLADPAAWIDRVAGRIPCIHYTDGTIDADRQNLMCEVGAGNLNWPRINAASAAAGVEWYLVERDAGELDPFDSLEISLKNMRAMGL